MIEGRQADKRSLNFAGDVDQHGQSLPMTVEVLQARADSWPQSESMPDGVAALLARSRQMFVDGYYTYENFIDAATRSLQAVEAALRLRLNAGERVSFNQLIKQAQKDGLVSGYMSDILHAGRKLRNDQVHTPSTQVWPPVLAANIVGASHMFVAELFDKPC